jgi:hypothetical protein
MRSSSTAPCEAAGPAGSDDLSGHESREWTVSVAFVSVACRTLAAAASPHLQTRGRMRAGLIRPPSRTGSR